MNKRALLISKIKTYPEQIVEKIWHFVKSEIDEELQEGVIETFELMNLSESSLDDIWLTPEEEEAWKEDISEET